MTVSQPSLRRKITLGYYLIAALILAAAAFTYFSLMALEAKVLRGERSAELLDTTLEIRRFERNYFLHRQATDLAENTHQIELTRRFLDEGVADLAAQEGVGRIDHLRALLDAYQARMGEYAAAADPGALATAEGAARTVGKSMVGIAEEMATAERALVRHSLSVFRQGLVAAIGAIALLMIVVGGAISRSISAPLKAIEVSLDAVSQGSRTHLLAPTSDREIVAVTDAVNHMLRDLELRRKHLVQSEKLAALGTMLAGVAHELNNPLSNISTSCQILLEEEGTGDAATRLQFLQQIDDQTQRARHIVAVLLDFARERQRSRHEPVPLRALMTQTIAAIRGEMPAHAEPHCDVAPDITVLGDPGRLQQALVNLVRNAMEATAGTGRVEVSARLRQVVPGKGRDDAPFSSCPLSGEVVDIEIADTGPGIPADALPRIFDPFFTTKEVGKGMGLGLFVTHGIVEEHDGCIAVTTAPGHGTTFHLRLPGLRRETQS